MVENGTKADAGATRRAVLAAIGGGVLAAPSAVAGNRQRDDRSTEAGKDTGKSKETVKKSKGKSKGKGKGSGKKPKPAAPLLSVLARVDQFEKKVDGAFAMRVLTEVSDLRPSGGGGFTELAFDVPAGSTAEMRAALLREVRERTGQSRDAPPDRVAVLLV